MSQLYTAYANYTLEGYLGNKEINVPTNPLYEGVRTEAEARGATKTAIALEDRYLMLATGATGSEIWA